MRRKRNTTKKTTKADPKVVFRRSKQWATFRTKIKKSQKTDPVTGSPLAKGFNLHHLDENPEHYTDISDESHFIGLNSTTHTVLHFLWGDGVRRYDWKTRLERLKELCELMDEINDINNKEVENE